MFKKTIILLGMSAVLTGCVGYPYDSGTSINTRYIDTTPNYYDYYDSGFDRYNYEYYRDNNRRSNYQRDRDDRRGRDGRRNRDGDSRSHERNDARHDQGNNGSNQNNASPKPVMRGVQNQNQRGNPRPQREEGQIRGGNLQERGVVLPDQGGRWQNGDNDGRFRNGGFPRVRQ